MNIFLAIAEYGYGESTTLSAHSTRDGAKNACELDYFDRYFEEGEEFESLTWSDWSDGIWSSAQHPIHPSYSYRVRSMEVQEEKPSKTTDVEEIIDLLHPSPWSD